MALSSSPKMFAYFSRQGFFFPVLTQFLAFLKEAMGTAGGQYTFPPKALRKTLDLGYG